MKHSRLRVAVLGYGYWGPNLVRNFRELEDAEVAAVCDLHWTRKDHWDQHFPALRRLDDWRAAVRDPGVDAVVISTPVSTHFEIARETLRQGKHALVEKPLALRSEEARELVDLAASRDLVLMVGHTFIYHGAVRKIRDLLAAGELGEVLYLDSTRANLGILRDDINVVWDLAPHDISIMDFLLGQAPLAVSATGSSHTRRRLEDVAFLSFQFRGDLIGHINVNWLSPVKVRTLLIGGTRKMIAFDDNEPREKVRVYDHGLERLDTPGKRHNDLIHVRAGSILVPQLDLTEALHIESRDFVDSIRDSRSPEANGAMGLRVVRLLEYASKSLALGGASVSIDL